MEKAEDHKGKQFIVQLDETVESVERLISRAAKVSSCAHEENRDVARRSKRRMKILSEALHEAVAKLDELLIDPSDELKALAQKLEEN